MRQSALLAFALALAGCASEGDDIFDAGKRAWKPVNSAGISVADARTECDARAQEATAAITFLSRRLALRRRLADDCLVKRGY